MPVQLGGAGGTIGGVGAGGVGGGVTADSEGVGGVTISGGDGAGKGFRGNCLRRLAGFCSIRTSSTPSNIMFICFCGEVLLIKY